MAPEADERTGKTVAERILGNANFTGLDRFGRLGRRKLTAGESVGASVGASVVVVMSEAVGQAAMRSAGTLARQGGGGAVVRKVIAAAPGSKVVASLNNRRMGGGTMAMMGVDRLLGDGGALCG